jgi:hypothetical protein
MSAISKPLDQVTKADLEALVSDGVCENRVLDFKLKQPLDADAEKLELAADVASFANAIGGDLVVGAQPAKDAQGKSTGAAEKMVGVSGLNYDQTVTRMQSILLDHVTPRITGITFHQVDGFEAGPVMIVRVPRSWQAPHMVKKTGRFHARHSTGKYTLDVGEIRSAFLQSDGLRARVREFRAERLGRIGAGEFPVTMIEGPRTVLHILPVASLAEGPLLDPRRFRDQNEFLMPLHSRGWDPHFNFDGFVVAHTVGGGEYSSYVQVFRNGAVEAVESAMMDKDDGRRLIPSQLYEEEILNGLDRYLKLLSKVEIQPPYVVMLSLLGIRGFVMGTSRRPMFRRACIDRDDLVLPDRVLLDVSEPLDRFMQPLFDSVWQSFGFEQSLNYDANGKWVGQRNG